MSVGGKAVFLSYASQDAEAARRIAEALIAAGVEVWFDQSELRGGDAWDAAIRRQIKECALFVPIISANTQSRPEGYFRLEWRLADQRTHLMGRSKAFLMPVSIDDTRDTDADVPDSFSAVQWTRLRQAYGGQARTGEEDPELARFVARVKRLLGLEVAQASSLLPKSDAGWRPAPPQGRSTRRPWLVPAVVGAVVVAAALFVWRPWKSGQSALSSSALSSSLSPARELVAKARHLFEEEDDSNRENFLLAEDLLLQAEKLDPFDGEVWAAHAQLSGAFLNLGYDSSDQRRADLRRQAERAIKLAPDSLESQLANAHYLLSQRGTLPEAERMLTALIKRAPDDWRPLRIMANVVLRQERSDEGYAWADRAAAFPEGAAVVLVEKATWLFIDGRFDKAERAVDESLAIRPLGRALLLKIRAQVLWQGDLDGARATVDKVPPSLLLEDRGAFNAYRVWLWRREPDKALSVLRGVSRDFLEDGQFIGPKAVLMASAQRLAGRPDLARPEWDLALRLIDERLRGSPNQSRLLYLRTLCLVELGRIPEAEEALRAFRQTDNEGYQMWPGGGLPGLLIKLGRHSEAMDHLAKEQQSGIRLFNSRAVLGLNPDFDPLRGDPRFQEILARAPGPAQTVAVAAISDSKSIAVLPFTNLSADGDANAFFADGIHDDVIASLFNVGDLHVVSRTSVMQYRDTTKPVRQIAQELGVAYVLEGGVQRADKRIRVTAKLMKAGTEKPLWAKQYDRALDDIFAIQSELALEITRSLQAVITPEEKSRIERLPTENLAAYDLYLKARESRHRGGSLRTMETLLRAAVELDATFADAWSELARVHAEIYFANQERTPERIGSAKAAIDRAVSLAPGSPEVIRNLGNYFLFGHRDFARASEQFEKLALFRPNDPETAISLGENQSRQGRWADALVNFRKATQLDRSNIDFANRFRNLLRAGRRWDEAIVESRRIAAIQPDRIEAAFNAAFTHFLARGSRQEVEEFFAGLPAHQAGSPPHLRLRLNWAIASGDYAEALRLDRLYPANEPRPSFDLGLGIPMILYAQGDVADARARVAEVAAEERDRFEREPTNHWALWKLGLAEAILGNKKEALRCARLAMEMMPESLDALEGPRMTNKLALIYAWAGEKERALEEATRQLHTPNIDTVVHLMRHDPWWFPLRGDPRFEALLDDPESNAPLF